MAVKQCTGAMTFSDPDPDPAIFVTDPSKRKQKTNFYKMFFCLLLFEGTFKSFFKDKKVGINRNQGFSYYFCLTIEGSGSIPLTNGSGSGRPKNKWIRIRNTAVNTSMHHNAIQAINLRKVKQLFLI
jgi:hypothetical protein